MHRAVVIAIKAHGIHLHNVENFYPPPCSDEVKRRWGRTKTRGGRNNFAKRIIYAGKKMTKNLTPKAFTVLRFLEV